MPLPRAREAVVGERSPRLIAPIRFPAALRLWHLASLDAPAVAVVWTLSFARTAGVPLPLWVPVLVGLGTWWVYVADRILDARRALSSGSVEMLRERHFFHWRHRRILGPLAGLGAAISAGIIFGQMPAVVREHDSVLALAALVYFSGVHAPGAPGQRWFAQLWSKELVVGVLFTAGCALPTVTRLHAAHVSGASMVWVFLMIGLFAGLAWLNCAAIDGWESGGGSPLTWPAGMIGAAAILLSLASALWEPRFASLGMACAASTLLLALLDQVRWRLTPLALRCAADIVLLMPVVCLVR